VLRLFGGAGVAWGLGVLSLIVWLAMLVVTVLVVYWIWVIQDRSNRMAQELAEIKALLQERKES